MKETKNQQIKLNQNLPKGWRKVRLGEICDFVKGKKPSKVFDRKISEEMVEYLLLEGGRLFTWKQKGLIEVGPPDILVVADGASSGLVLYNRKGILGSTFLRIRIKKENIELINFRYLYFFLKNSENILKSVLTGSAIPHVDQENLRLLEIKFPEDLNEQKRIASILSAFDDKIELNNKINKTLEEMAQAIFKHWFVDFKFPGHEKTKFVNSELGKIPEGWEVKNLSQIANVISRGSNLEYISDKNKGIPVLNQRCIRDGGIFPEAIQYAKPVNSKFYLKKWDILINSMGTGTLGRVSRNLSIDYPMIIHNCITFVRSENPAIQLYLYYQLKLQEKYFEQLAIGSTGQTSLPIEVVKQFRVLLPLLDILENFFAKIEPLWVLMGRNKSENQKLVELRDLLLPKLMSGEIRI